jgi:DNA-binding CsgD family transcriptional regulator
MVGEPDNTEGKSAPRSFGQLAQSIEELWPSFKYLGFGCYYAWIFLCYNSFVLFPADAFISGFSLRSLMYLSSTAALSLTLLLSALFHGTVTRYVKNFTFVMVASLVASVATALVIWFSSSGTQLVPVIVFDTLTGVGTAFVALRFGVVYSTVGARKALMYTAGSFVFACMMYFVVVGLPHALGVILMVGLPALAAVLTATLGVSIKTEENKTPVVPIKNLPHGFFARFIFAITVFSIIAGYYNGLSVTDAMTASLENNGPVMMFATATIAIVLFLAVGMISRNFDLSRLYYPIIILACFGAVVVPLFGAPVSMRSTFVSIAYNLFIMFVWCLLALVSHRTDLDAVHVFGWGRGASGLGTTLGWAAAVFFDVQAFGDDASTTIAVVMVLALIVVSMVVLKEGTIDDVLSQTDSSEDEARMDKLFPEATSVSGDVEKKREGRWKRSCSQIAKRCGLSDREHEVLVLLGKGRTIDFIANDLSISFNTAKSHIRHVYTKLGVHSRQELIDIIEDNRTD